MSSEGVTDEAKYKNCAAVIKCTGGSTSGLLRHLNSIHSIEKPTSIQSDVSSNTQSAIYMPYRYQNGDCALNRL